MKNALQRLRSSFEKLIMRMKTMSESDVRRLTNEWIMNQRTDEAQLNEVRNILDQTKEHTEWINEIVVEAFSILIERQLWRTKFETKKKALATLNNSMLKNIRARARTNRNRKIKYIERIKAMWSQEIKEWMFDNLNENYLFNMTSIAKRYIYSKTKAMILRIATSRVKQNLSERESMRTIIAKDWSDLKIMRKRKTRNLLLENNSTSMKMSELDIAVVHLFQDSIKNIRIESRVVVSESKIRISSKNERSIHTNDDDDASLFETDDDEVMNERNEDLSNEKINEIDDEKDDDDDKEIEAKKSASKSTDDRRERDVSHESKRKRKACKCEDLSNALLERIKRKNSIRARMKSDIECIDILKAIIQARHDEVSLRHVCHRHLYVMSGHFDLQVKSLKTMTLRQRLIMLWRNRNSLNESKLSVRHRNWFKLSSQRMTTTMKFMSDDRDWRGFLNSLMMKESRWLLTRLKTKARDSDEWRMKI